MKKLIRRTVSAMLALLLNAGLLCAVPAQAASADAPAAAVETAAVGSDGEDGSETAEQEPSAAAETQTETISGKSVSDCTVSLNQTSFYFNGKARHPAVTVTDGSVTLTKNKDYSVVYRDNVFAGTGRVIVTGIGEYSGSVTEAFQIVNVNLAPDTERDVNIKVEGDRRYFAFVPDTDMTVRFYSTGSCDTVGSLYDDKLNMLKTDDDSGEDRNFDITYAVKANTTYYVSCRHFYSSAAGSFKVKLTSGTKSVADCTVTLKDSFFIYNGQRRNPAVTVTDGGKTLAKDADFSVEYRNDVNAGTAEAVVRGMGAYTGSVTKPFTIAYANIVLNDKRVIKAVAGKVRYFKFVPSADMNIRFRSERGKGTRGRLYDADRKELRSDSGDNFYITYSVKAKTAYIVSCEFSAEKAEGEYYIIVEPDVKPVANCKVTVDPATVIFNGRARYPAVTVEDGGKQLKKDTDYTVKYEDNVSVGTGKVTVTGKGVYTGSVENTFGIAYANIALNSRRTVSVSTADDTRYFKFVPETDMRIKFCSAGDCDTCGYLYDENLNLIQSDDESGDGHNFSITRLLSANTTYIYACKLYGSADKGSYQVKLDRVIRPISGCTVTLDKTSFFYNGKEHCPAVTVRDRYATLIQDKDYTVTYQNNTEEGEGSVTVTGINNYDGEVSETFSIDYETMALSARKTVDVTEAGDTRYFKITLESGGWFRFSSANSSSQTVGCLYDKDDAEKNPIQPYQEDVGDNNVSSLCKVNAGTYILTCKFEDDTIAEGSYSVIFEAAATPISACDVELRMDSFAFNGKERRPAVTVRDGEKTLVEKKDYTVAYEDNVNVGTGKVIVTGINNCEGSVTKEFTIAYAALAPDTDRVIKIDKAGDVWYFKIESGSNTRLRFYSDNSCDAVGCLYDEGMHEITPDTSVEGKTFDHTYTVNSDTVYIIKCSLRDGNATGNFYVKIKPAQAPAAE